MRRRRTIWDRRCSAWRAALLGPGQAVRHAHAADSGLRPVGAAFGQHSSNTSPAGHSLRTSGSAGAIQAQGGLVASPLRIPPGTVLRHDGIRIVFVEEIDDYVLRFVIEGSEEEFLVAAGEDV